MSHTTDEVISFLTYLADKGFMPKNTAQSRKLACSSLFSVLSPNEMTVNYVKSNLDMIAKQLENKNPEKFTASTLETYKSRVSSSIEDFLEWKANRKLTEEKIAKKSNIKKTINSEKKSIQSKKESSSNQEKTNQGAEENTKAWNILLPIRSDFNIEIKIPKDMTKSELFRLGMFLFPYCTDFSQGDLPPTWPTIK